MMLKVMKVYSTRSKAYKCLNTNSNKIMESANVKIDEYVKVHEDEPKEEPENYKNFMYYYEGMNDGNENQVSNQQESVNVESHIMDVSCI